MANEYIINYSSDSVKAPFTIQPRTVDSQTVSLTLFGKGAASYGEGLQENLVRLLENFCSPVSPTHPTIGQLWYDTTLQQLKVYKGTNDWGAVQSDVSVGPVAPLVPTAGTLWYDLPHSKLFVFDGTNWIVASEQIPATRSAAQLLSVAADGATLEFKTVTSANGTLTVTPTVNGLDIQVTADLTVADGGSY
jgi:hypothetical protein